MPQLFSSHPPHVIRPIHDRRFFGVPLGKSRRRFTTPSGGGGQHRIGIAEIGGGACQAHQQQRHEAKSGERGVVRWQRPDQHAARQVRPRQCVLRHPEFHERSVLHPARALEQARLLADHAAAAHEQRGDGGALAVPGHPEHVGVARVRRHHVLRHARTLEQRDLVAALRGQLVPAGAGRAGDGLSAGLRHGDRRRSRDDGHHGRRRGGRRLVRARIDLGRAMGNVRRMIQ